MHSDRLIAILTLLVDEMSTYANANTLNIVGYVSHKIN